MALDFKKVSPSGARPQGGSGAKALGKAASPAAGNGGPTRWHGRSRPPPPPGSGWTAFLDWASEGAFEYSREDAALAMRFWTGGEVGDDEASLPAP